MKIQLNIPLSDDEYKKFIFIKETIEEERELQPTDYDSIALMVVNMTVLNDALNSIREDGAIIYSETKYGRTGKGNPSNEIMFKANTQIKSLLEQLLCTPKSKASVKAIAEKEPEELDPLTVALMNRNKNK